MRRWQMLHPRHHYTRSDGRVILTLAIVGLLALGVHLVSSHTGPAARGPHASSAPAPSTPPDDPPEIHSEREAIRQDERDVSANWIWQPSEAEVANHRDDSAMLFIGPIVGKQTGNRLEADVYVNKRPVARADRVAVLMWQTRQDPVFIDVVKSGYERWGFRYRFQLDELRRVEGPVELSPEDAPDDTTGGVARR